MALRGWLETALAPRRRPPPIYLHIGAMKTGTTYLQQVMGVNRQALAGAGYLFPGRRWSDQSRAAREVLGSVRADTRVAPDGPWSTLVEEMMTHQGRASIYSMEFLSFANAEKASRVVSSFPGAEVHVILTVRDAAAVLPAQWQTSCRNAGTVPWPGFVNGLRQALNSDGPPRSRAERMFQRTQGIVRMLDVWEPLVGAERLHVVTVPPRGSDPSLLWERFAAVVGIDPDVAGQEPGSSNPSLGHPSTEFLRRLNVELSELPRRDYETIVRGPLRSMLGARSDVEPPVTLHRKGRMLAARWNRRVRSAILEKGVQLVGDVSDLPVRRPEPSTPELLFEPGPEQILAAANTAREGMLDLEATLLSRLAGRGAAAVPPTGAAPHHSAVPVPAHEDDTADPEGRAVREVADLVRECVRLHHVLGAAADTSGRTSQATTTETVG